MNGGYAKHFDTTTHTYFASTHTNGLVTLMHIFCVRTTQQHILIALMHALKMNEPEMKEPSQTLPTKVSK